MILTSAYFKYASLTPRDLDEALALIERIYLTSEFSLGGQWTASGLAYEIEKGASWGIWSFGSDFRALSNDKCKNKEGDVFLVKNIKGGIGRERVSELLGLSINQSLGGGVFEILFFGVDPILRGVGCARSLLEWGAIHLGASELQLEVHGDNLRAQRFYLAAGFEQVGVRKGYYADGGAAMLMTWRRKS